MTILLDFVKYDIKFWDILFLGLTLSPIKLLFKQNKIGIIFV